MALEQNNEQHYREIVDKFVDPAVSYQMSTRDYVVRPSTSDAAITITLPPVAEAIGRFYSIVARAASNTYPITIASKGDSEGWDNVILANESEGVLLYSDGMKWFVNVGVQPSEYGTNRIGGFNTGAALTDAIPFTTGMNTWADGQLDTFAVFSGSGVALGSGYSAKSGRFRHVINGITCTQETYGLVGQVVARDAALNHLHAGLMGTFEGHTSGVTLNGPYGCCHAGVIARIGGHAAITANTPLAGFLAFNNASANLVSGDTVAFKAEALSATYPWTYGLYLATGKVITGISMSVTTQGIASIVTALPAAGIGHSFYVTVSAPNNQSGMSAYFDATINGTTAGHCYGVGSWINTGDTSPVLSAGHIIVPFEGGVYTGEAQAAARIVFAGQHQAILNGAPASLHAWRLNATQTVTAVIAAANPGSVGFVAGAGTSGVQVGYIPIADIVGVGVVYIRVYSSAT